MRNNSQTLLPRRAGCEIHKSGSVRAGGEKSSLATRLEKALSAVALAKADLIIPLRRIVKRSSLHRRLPNHPCAEPTGLSLKLLR